MAKKVRYRTKVLDGTLVKTVRSPKMIKDPNNPSKKIFSGEYEVVEKEVPAGYMVFFPHGNSIHVWTDSEMKRLGFTTVPGQEAQMDDDEGGDYEELAGRIDAKSRQESFVG